MRPVLERCDDERLPACLEATSPRNRALYERHRFEVTEQFAVGPGVAARVADVADSRQVSLSATNRQSWIRSRPSRRQEFPGRGDMRPSTCDVGRAEDGGVTANRDVSGASIGEEGERP